MTLKQTSGRSLLPQAVPSGPTLQKRRNQWEGGRPSFDPCSRERGPTHHVYPVWKSNRLKLISQVPTASSKTDMRQERRRGRIRKPATAFHDQRCGIHNQDTQEQSF